MKIPFNYLYGFIRHTFATEYGTPKSDHMALSSQRNKITTQKAIIMFINLLISIFAPDVNHLF
ncbi:MAG: hypothetical protein CMI08_06250 [Oceanospirillaceae bacterium]|nr:hypothetical protein [Oceanospirillaceae bacterium]MAX98797.1 hypothetical protein [Oceanospirillaceae bacterium]|tara:strand:+ start:537 stop:725 length:189 start_codon:yes stop_codon:yes gene_type:complete